MNRTSVNKWVSIYLNEGIEGLKEKPRSGQPTFLSVAQQKQLAQFINQARSDEGGRLTGADIHAYIEKEFNKTYHTDSIYYLLKKMGFSWITSRSKHPKHDKQAQENFKKFQIKTIFNIPEHIALERVDIWHQDEARFGQQNTTTRLWSPTGSRPRAVKQQQFEYAYLFGSVCINNGASQAMVVPFVNKNIMEEHLAPISRATASGRHAVIPNAFNL